MTRSILGVAFDIDTFKLDLEDRMEKAVEVFQKELMGIRTGRASAAFWSR